MPRICRSHPACCSELEDSPVARGTFCETLVGEELSCGGRKIKQKQGQHRVLTCSQMCRACPGWGWVIPKCTTGLEISRSGILVSCWFFHWFLSARQVCMKWTRFSQTLPSFPVLWGLSVPKTEGGCSVFTLRISEVWKFLPHQVSGYAHHSTGCWQAGCPGRWESTTIFCISYQMCLPLYLRCHWMWHFAGYA